MYVFGALQCRATARTARWRWGKGRLDRALTIHNYGCRKGSGTRESDAGRRQQQIHLMLGLCGEDAGPKCASALGVVGAGSSWEEAWRLNGDGTDRRRRRRREFVEEERMRCVGFYTLARPHWMTKPPRRAGLDVLGEYYYKGAWRKRNSYRPLGW